MPLSGATQAEVRSHYDRSDAFYALWLGQELVYSCALWAGARSLHDAQERKLHFHLSNLQLPPQATLLDIGCGWGSLLRFARQRFPVKRSVGLTLSDNQWRFSNDRPQQGIEVHLQSWTEHEPRDRYDGLVSIGAFEHFTRPEQSALEKATIYRAFFQKCRDWLRPEARMSLQTIAYGSLRPEDASTFMQNVIFPGSELPCVDEVTTAARPNFDVLHIRNDAEDYAKTCEAWLRNLQRNRHAAHDLVGMETTGIYEHYLRLSAIGFRTGRIVLLRLLLQRRGP